VVTPQDTPNETPGDQPNAGPADLSVMIPCRNNARTMGRVLGSVRGLASQLVVVDSGSTDGTLELVRACRDWCEVVLIRTHWRGFVRTKQIALDACTRRYALWLDSDEPVSPELADSVRGAIGRGIDAGEVRRVVEYKGRLLMHCWQPEYRTRLVRAELARSGAAYFEGIDPHDFLWIDPERTTERLGGLLVHDSFETFAEHLRNQLRLQSASARALHEHGETTNLVRLVWSPLGAWGKQMFFKRSWRDGYAGWLAASTSAAGTLMKHMMLYELMHDPDARPDAGVKRREVARRG